MTSDPFWLLAYSREEMERLAADAARKLDEAVAATAWSTTAVINASTLSHATKVEDLEYTARLMGYMPAHRATVAALLSVRGVLRVDNSDAAKHVKVWVAADTTDNRMSEIVGEVRCLLPATVFAEVVRKENPGEPA